MAVQASQPHAPPMRLHATVGKNKPNESTRPMKPKRTERRASIAVSAMASTTPINNADQIPKCPFAARIRNGTRKNTRDDAKPAPQLIAITRQSGDAPRPAKTSDKIAPWAIAIAAIDATACFARMVLTESMYKPTAVVSTPEVGGSVVSRSRWLRLSNFRCSTLSPYR